MRRHIFLMTVLLTLGVGALSILGLRGQASSHLSTKAVSRTQNGITLTVRTTGPDQATVDAAINTAWNHPDGGKWLSSNRVRFLSFELLEPARLRLGLGEPYRVTFFDYTNNRAFAADGELGNPAVVRYSALDYQPTPSAEEFTEAINLVRNDPRFSEDLQQGLLVASPAMPPLLNEATGVPSERTLNVGLRSRSEKIPNQIVSVNLVRGAVQTWPTLAPPTSISSPEACGVPGAGQGTTARNTAGQYELIASQAGTEIWRMTVVRPSVSSGTRASGVELRNVLYRGKTLFKRAHVPILNVRYANNFCGPYRDWQWQEGTFVCNAGTDVAAGVRLCASAPETILENFTDTGNFRGVGIYQDGTSVVIVSELEAGWYRYVSRWRFFMDGTVQPEFGFDGVDNSCVCNDHYHHVFWRFDIDVAQAGKNRIMQFDTPRYGVPLTVEGKEYRDYVRGRFWTIENVATGAAFKLEPGEHDQTAAGDTYARYDLVFLRYKSGATNLAAEYDDGRNSTGPSNTEANLDQFITGESLESQDVVIWYGAHFDHVDTGGRNSRNRPEDHSPVLGPRLVPLRW